MSRPGATAAFVLTACLALPEEAMAVEDDPAIIASLTLGTVGGISSAVAALVYALDDRSYDGPWVVVALFSAAVCGAMTGALIADGLDQGFETGHGVGILFYGGLTAWPLYWTIRGALSPVEPGERFDAAPVAPEGAAAWRLPLGQRPPLASIEIVF